MSMRQSMVMKLLLFGMSFLFIERNLAYAQTGPGAEFNAGVEFNFSTPGARSLALGGAFLGLADDATAAFANPAGLTILSKPEVSVEGRRWGYSPDFIDRGHAFGDPTNIGVDNVRGLVSESSDDEVTGLSFVSFVYPGKRWAAAVYRQELANFKSTSRTNGAFFDVADPVTPHFRLRPADAQLDLKIISYGVSGAYRVHENLSVGLAVSSHDYTFDSTSKRYDLAHLGGFYDPPNYDPENVVNRQNQHGDDQDVTLSGGILWKVNPAWSIGAIYRQGPKFSFETKNTRGPAAGPGQDGVVVAQGEGTLHVPDVFGVGVAFRPVDAWTITVDYDRVRYSRLTESTFTALGSSNQREAASHLVADDADEIHLGAEYVWTLQYPVSFRVGGWLDPDHRIHYDGAATTAEQRAAAVQFPRGDDEIHYSAGFGVVFSEKFQIDAATDISDLVKTASLSGVFRF